ncbi:hypothetical protein L1987_35003 [Smallanthus sonchifolius]|uniref:Uncharacterized protein n=1 Tax=Smallanthus sonchifolius TaxID=185202 RepID=A0ACB9HUU1_9ASTR|nr:hypothetical protein L1987_35003 [Smallanthus sonchifolius]
MDSQTSFEDQYSLRLSVCSWETPNWKYDVYLNSKNERICSHGKTFTDRLYTALTEADIHTFKPDELQLGVDDIPSDRLLKEIEESKISIVVFSKEFASCRFCLNKLVKIMDCRNTRRQLVLPVFHHVDPADIRKQSGSFEAAFARHEKLLNLEKIKEW